jgi:hypothetical protein
MIGAGGDGTEYNGIHNVVSRRYRCASARVCFINGFHDAANAIATSVSTRVLNPHRASARHFDCRIPCSTSLVCSSTNRVHYLRKNGLGLPKPERS